MAKRARFNRKIFKVIFISTLCGAMYSMYLYTPTGFNYKNHFTDFNWSETDNSLSSKTEAFATNLTHVEPPPLRIPANETFKYEPPVMSQATIDELIQEGSLLNMPKDKIMLSGFPLSNHSKPCAKFPTIYDINYSNTHWQVYEYGSKRWRFYAKAAFLDTRVLNTQKASIRVIGVFEIKYATGIVPHRRPRPRYLNIAEFTSFKQFCQIWFWDEPNPVISPVKTSVSLKPHSIPGTNYDLLASVLTCHIPESHLSKIPFSVSVVESPCSLSTVNLEVFYDNPRKKKNRFAVCVKALEFPNTDISLQLIEWIELHYILGVGKIFIPELVTTPDTKKVLEYYHKLGKIEVKPTTYPSMLPVQPALRHEYRKNWRRVKIQAELIDFEECFYRNMYKCDYIAIIDIDEVFVPRRHFNWVDMMSELETRPRRNKGQYHFSFKNVYYFYDADTRDHEHFADIPNENLMLQHVRRTRVGFSEPEPQFSKCIQNTETAVGIFHHHPVRCLEFGQCKIYHVEEKDALMHHYKPLNLHHEPDWPKRFQTESVLDNTIWRYKDELILRVNQTATRLQLI